MGPGTLSCMNTSARSNFYVQVQKAVEGLLGAIVLGNRQGFDRATYYSIYNQLVELLQEVDGLDPDKVIAAPPKPSSINPMMPCAPADLVWPIESPRRGSTSNHITTDLPSSLPLAFDTLVSFQSANTSTTHNAHNPASAAPSASSSPASSPASSPRTINVGSSSLPTVVRSLSHPQAQLARTVISTNFTNISTAAAAPSPATATPASAGTSSPVASPPQSISAHGAEGSSSSSISFSTGTSTSTSTSKSKSKSAAHSSTAARSSTGKRSKPRKPRNLVCSQCGTSSTPEWRKGPTGEHSLCNACGLMYAKRLKKERLEQGMELPPPRKKKEKLEQTSLLQAACEQQSQSPPHACAMAFAPSAYSSPMHSLPHVHSQTVLMPLHSQPHLQPQPLEHMHSLAHSLRSDAGCTESLQVPPPPVSPPLSPLDVLLN